MAEVLQNPLNDRWILDAGDDLELPPAAPADLDLDGKHPFQALCPGHCPLPVTGRWLTALVGLAGSSGLSPGHDPGPLRARRRKHAVIAGQVRTGLWHQRGKR